MCRQFTTLHPLSQASFNPLLFCRGYVISFSPYLFLRTYFEGIAIQAGLTQNLSPLQVDLFGGFLGRSGRHA
jgi:hypothetical protein